MTCSQEPYGNVSISFKANQIVLTRHFFNCGLVETSLFFKLPLEEEDNSEEALGSGHWLVGDWKAKEEQLARIKNETSSLVKELKDEWIGWQELPFFPPSVQFKPGYYVMTSSEFNWPGVGNFDPAEINYDDDGDNLDYKFLIAPKVKAVVFYLSKV